MKRTSIKKPKPQKSKRRWDPQFLHPKCINQIFLSQFTGVIVSTCKCYRVPNLPIYHICSLMKSEVCRVLEKSQVKDRSIPLDLVITTLNEKIQFFLSQLLIDHPPKVRENTIAS